MESDSLKLIILLILLAFSAFFSASETALMALSRIKVRNMVENKVKKAKILEKLLAKPSKLLGAILIGNNLVNIGASALATSLAISHFGQRGVGIATGIMTVLVLIFGEIAPKSLAKANSESVSLKVSKPMNLITLVLSPLTGILLFITNGIMVLLGKDPNETKPFITEEELRTMVQVSHEEGVLKVEERRLIDNVFEFRESQVKDVMKSRIDMIAVEDDISYDELMDTFKETGFSRLPVYVDTIDNIIGVCYIKDLILNDVEKENFLVADHVREPFFTYESQRISRLFEQLRTRRIALAIVLDEYGGTAGITTLEDLIEEIVGELEDEYDTVTKDIEQLSDKEYNVSGHLELDEINEKLHLGIESEHYETIGGFILGEVGSIPEVGEEVVYKNIVFKVLSLDRKRIEKINIKIK